MTWIFCGGSVCRCTVIVVFMRANSCHRVCKYTFFLVYLLNFIAILRAYLVIFNPVWLKNDVLGHLKRVLIVYKLAALAWFACVVAQT